jgi:hypothetical protein
MPMPGLKLIVALLTFFFFQSAIFTGRFGYLMSGLWITGGIVFAAVLLVSKIFFPRKKERYTDLDYFLERYQVLTVVLCVLLTALVM